MNPPIESRDRMTALALHRQLQKIWATGPGWQRLAAVNHSVLGVRFMATALVFFAIAGVLGMLTRVQLATPRATFMDTETYNQVFTMHGSMMLFLFAIPMLEGIAVYLTPKMLGTRDFAFPRLTAYGYWCYLFGGTILATSLVAGVAPDGGWFMYTPLSSNVYTPGINADVWLLGVTFVEISALSLAVEMIVSVLKMRAPGMSLDRMPIFGWYILVTALMMLVAFPPLILGSACCSRRSAPSGLPFLRPDPGAGDALLWALHLVLALRSPGRLHHPLADGRSSFDDNPGFRRYATRRLQGHRRCHHRSCIRQFWHLGAPHVYCGNPAPRTRVLLCGVNDRRGSNCDTVICLARHARPWPAALERAADALHLRLLRYLCDRRPHGRDARDRASFDWQAHNTLFRRRPLPLCDRAALSPSRYWQRSIIGCHS